MPEPPLIIGKPWVVHTSVQGLHRSLFERAQGVTRLFEDSPVGVSQGLEQHFSGAGWFKVRQARRGPVPHGIHRVGDREWMQAVHQ